jgi:hypothetical protein
VSRHGQAVLGIYLWAIEPDPGCPLVAQASPSHCVSLSGRVRMSTVGCLLFQSLAEYYLAHFRMAEAVQGFRSLAPIPIS